MSSGFRAPRSRRSVGPFTATAASGCRTNWPTAVPRLSAAGVTLESEVEPLGLDAEKEHALSLAVREAITDVIRHACARRCTITLSREADAIRLVVEDDGVGGEHVEGAGLSGMRARLSQVGGTLLCEGQHGTRLTLVVPDRHRAPSDAMVCS